jgi:RES domain-containing protein
MRPQKIWLRVQSRWDGDALPAGRVSIAYGSDWVASRQSACLIVPSLIVPEERNILINPTHLDAGRLSATKIRKWLYDARLR